MNFWLKFLVAAGVFVLTEQQAAAAGELAAPIAACIRDNAPKVEQAIPSLTDGVEFLVGSICAVEVSAINQQQMVEQQRRASERWQKWCEEQRRAPQSSTEGQAVDVCAYTKLGFVTEDGEGWTIYAPTVKPATATALAARLLMDLRLARQAREGRR
jgi:hypothetical protein